MTICQHCWTADVYIRYILLVVDKTYFWTWEMQATYRKSRWMMSIHNMLTILGGFTGLFNTKLAFRPSCNISFWNDLRSQRRCGQANKMWVRRTFPVKTFFALDRIQNKIYLNLPVLGHDFHWMYLKLQIPACKYLLHSLSDVDPALHHQFQEVH